MPRRLRPPKRLGTQTCLEQFPSEPVDFKVLGGQEAFITRKSLGRRKIIVPNKEYLARLRQISNDLKVYYTSNKINANYKGIKAVSLQCFRKAPVHVLQHLIYDPYIKASPEVTFKIDLKNAFDQLSTEKIRASLLHTNLPVSAIEQLIKFLTVDGHLPQGFPTSAVISEHIFVTLLDHKHALFKSLIQKHLKTYAPITYETLVSYYKSHFKETFAYENGYATEAPDITELSFAVGSHIKYARWCDNIYIRLYLAPEERTKNVRLIIKLLERTIKSLGLSVNYSKSQACWPDHKDEILGLNLATQKLSRKRRKHFLRKAHSLRQSGLITRAIGVESYLARFS